MNRIRLLAAVLILATAGAYANSLSNPFVFDDETTIFENETIRSLTPISGVLSGPRQSATAGRPLVNLSFAINYAIGQFSPVGYHAVNLALHILSGLLLFGLVRRVAARAAPHDAARSATLARDIPAKKRAGSMDVAVRAPAIDDMTAFACALIWLLHPLQSEVINYVTQRTESMMALAFFGTLYAFVRSLDSDRPAAWQAVAVVSCSLGMLCKESMVTAPLVTLLLDVAFVAGGLRAAISKRPLFYTALAMSLVLLAVMNVSGPRSHSAGLTSGFDPWTYLLNQPSLLLRYFRLALVPYALVIDYGLPQHLSFGQVALPFSLVAALAVAAVFSWRWNPRIGFLATFVFITLAPTSSLLPIATEVGAERRMYLPLAAMTVLGAIALTSMARRRAAVALIALAIVFGGLTIQRNTEYRDHLTLWQLSLERYPHGRLHYSLALALKAAGRPEEGFAELRTAAATFAEADYALGFEFMERGRYGEAITYLRHYVEVKPDDVNVLRAYNLLGKCYLLQNQPAAAAEAFGETLKRQPGNIDALGGSGDAFTRLQRWDEAIVVYRQFLEKRVDRAAAFNLGMALAARNRSAEAIAVFEKVVEMAPGDPAAHAHLADLFLNVGNVERAIQEYERVAELDGDPDVRRDLQRLTAELRRRERR